VLVTFAEHLDKFGFIAYMSSQLTTFIGGFHWIVGGGLLVLVYFFSHYFFASSTAHVSAMYGAFLALGIQLGVPALPFALILGFLSSLFGGLTHYSMGQAPIFFAANYVDIKTWWKTGLFIGLLNLLIWIG